LVFLGLVLAAAMVLLGRGLIHRTEDDAAAVRVTQTRLEPPPPATKLPQPESTVPSPATADSLFRGRVIDAVTGEAVQKFEIQLQRLNTTKEAPPITRGFHSEDGTFAWQDAAVGNWYVTVTAPDYQRFVIEVLEIAAGQKPSELTVPMIRGYKVTGRVFDESSGAGVAEAAVTYGESGADVGVARSGFVLSNKDGSFSFDGVPLGRIRLVARSPQHSERAMAIVVGEQTPPVEIGLASGGSISGFVVTASGAPIAAPVALINEQNFSQIKRTSENGAFSFDHLAAGRYRIATGMVGAQEIVLAHDERREGVVLTAQSQGRSVRGTVTGLRRDEVEHAFVILRSQTRGARAMRPVDAQGEFVLNGVPPGPAEIRVSAGPSSRELRKLIEVPADKDLIVDLDLTAGVRLSGRVTQADKPVGAGKTVWMYPLPRERGTSYHGKTSADGTYRIEGVAAGEYEVMAAANANRRIRISDQDAVLDLQVPAVQLAGRVIEDGGTAPVVDAHVYATAVGAHERHIRPNDSSDHFGQFELAGLEPGEIVLSAYKRGYELFRERINYASPLMDLTIKLRPGTGVEVKARVAGSDAAVRELQITEQIAEGDMGIVMSMQLDENGVGSLPQGLAGSTLWIYGAGRQIVVREWDGQPLDLQLR
jgi:carboxypeptidase family protein